MADKIEVVELVSPTGSRVTGPVSALDAYLAAGYTRPEETKPEETKPEGNTGKAKK